MLILGMCVVKAVKSDAGCVKINLQPLESSDGERANVKMSRLKKVKTKYKSSQQTQLF